MKHSIFNQDFYPTPANVIETMLRDYDVTGKVVLEPSAGKGDIVDYLLANGAEDVIACELSPDLQSILKEKCQIITDDFMKLTSDQVSHINAIIMNPPFSADEKHILHAWNIAPAGCYIVSLCNTNTVENITFKSRIEIRTIVDQHGSAEQLGSCFDNAERKTNVEVSVVRIQKPGAGYETEFEGFFMEEDPEEEQANGLMPYNFIRDLVNRYIAGVKIFDEQIESAVKMNNLTSQFYGSSMAMHCSVNEKPIKRNQFKKDLQKSAWNFIFSKMNMQKFATRGLREDINRFVEQQTQIPFTMRNIFRMLDIVVGTHEQRMDKALLEVFEKVTKHYSENRYNVEGWKTNSHYLLNRKFILPNVVRSNYSGGMSTNYHGWAEPVEDMVKGLCFITGIDYSETTDLDSFFYNNKCRFGQLYHWGFFTFRGYKKGTIHLTFQSEDLWAKYNQRISKILGYPLPEADIKAGKVKQKPGEESPISEPEKNGEISKEQLLKNYDYLLESNDEQEEFDVCKKNIRIELKRTFPGVKFSVTSRNYNTVDIRWTDGPSQKKVEKVIEKYEAYQTDETGDFRDYYPTTFTKTFGGAKYVFASREKSEDVRLKFLEWADYCFEKDEDYGAHSADVLAHRLFYQVDIPNEPFSIVRTDATMGSCSPEVFWKVLPNSELQALPEHEQPEDMDIDEEPSDYNNPNQISLF